MGGCRAARGQGRALIDQDASTQSYHLYVCWSSQPTDTIIDKYRCLTMYVGPVMTFAEHYRCA
jgi:hypothetical protein